MIAEDKLQPSTKDKNDEKGKEIIPSPNPKVKGKVKEIIFDEVDLEEDIVIQNHDLSSMVAK